MSVEGVSSFWKMEFPDSQEFLKRCDEYTNSGTIDHDYNCKIDQEIKMLEIEHDLKSAVLKVQSQINDAWTLGVRGIKINTVTLSKYKEAHVHILDIISKVGEEKGYTVASFTIPGENMTICMIPKQ